jgi:L-malate glycosyltransferase
MPGLTVALATHNGAPTLPRVLDGYLRATPPGCDWRLVIVDNASTDDTAAVIARYRDRLPIVFLTESRRGKNRALNAAIPSFTGSLVVLTDDDAIPAPDFLLRWSEAADSHPGYAMFGGAVRPAWPDAPPSWLLSSTVEMTSAFSITPDIPAGEIEPEMIFGPNMAIRRDVFANGLNFDESIGPNGRSYAMGSETFLTLRIAQLGHRAWFLPDIVVEHIIRPRQLTPEWLRQRALNFGRGLYRHSQLKHETDQAPRLFGIPRWMIRRRLERDLRAHLQLASSMLGRDPARIAGAKWWTAMAQGWWSEVIKQNLPSRARR